MDKSLKSNTKRFYQSKSFWGAFLFAVGLWIYISLNNEYITIVEIPFSVKLPATRAIENPIRPTISIEVKGKGWNIFEQIFINRSARVFIDLSNVEFTESAYEIRRTEIIRNIQFLKNLEAINVYPEFVTLQTGIIEIAKVPVHSLIKVIPRNGFTQVGPIRFFPDSIEIYGNKKVLSKIKRWNTKAITMSDLYNSVNTTIELSDSLSGILQLSATKVNAYITIQQEAEMYIPDIRISLKGGTPPPTNKLIPPFVSILVRGGINEIVKLNPDNIIANVNYEQILYDSTGLIKPEIIVPEHLKIVNINPPWIYHIRQISQFNLSARN